jgi:hypothetical protein
MSVGAAVVIPAMISGQDTLTPGRESCLTVRLRLDASAPTKARTQGRSRLSRRLRLVTAEDDAGVLAAEAETIGEDGAHISLARLVGHVI